jgi:NAD(P)-dependent dehydrogenase (short-subunit alcohol dehydrogenase family)
VSSGASRQRGVVVSGGTGALGGAVVERFLASAAAVTVPWLVKAEAEELGRAHPEAIAAGRLRLVETDVAEESGAAALAEAAGDVEVLVNGVGGFAGGAPVWETPLEVWDRMYRINLRSAVALSRAFLPGMLAHGRGTVVNVASQAAAGRPAGLAAYAASKAGVVLLTETLQKEVGERGVRIVAVAPDTIDTAANRAAMPDADPARWTSPQAIARVIFWLSGEDAAAVRSAVVDV